MRTSSEFRRTKTFSILSGEVKDLGSIANHYGGGSLVSVSRDPEEDFGIYVVRIVERKALIDVRVKVDYRTGTVGELERVVIISAPKESA